MMFEENASGITGLYNVSNTCYMNSVLQALSHVREFRECMLSDEAATSLYATDRSHESPRTKATVLAGEILSFPGFRKKRKRRKAESGVDKTSIVPLMRPPAMTRKGMANIAAAEHASLGGKPVLTRKQLNSTQNVV
jgi:uncharacterized UBP type Zn finger protein